MSTEASISDFPQNPAFLWRVVSAATVLLLILLVLYWNTQLRPFITPALPEGVHFSGPMTLFGNADFFRQGNGESQGDEAAAPKLQPGVHITRPLWQDLSSYQQTMLAGLQTRWPYLSNAEKRRWLATAQKARDLDEAAQHTLASRIAEWSSMSELQRMEMRRLYEERNAQVASAGSSAWLTYSALSDAEKAEWLNKANGQTASKAASARNSRANRNRLVRIPAATQARQQLANLPKIPLEPVSLSAQSSGSGQVPASTVIHVTTETRQASPSSDNETDGVRRWGGIVITPAEPLPPIYEN